MERGREKIKQRHKGTLGENRKQESENDRKNRQSTLADDNH